MKEKRDKKPNFLQEINAGILDDLTKHGRENNIAGLAGELTELEEVAQICGLPFSGYLAKIETQRPSGIVDEVVVAFTGEAAAVIGEPEIESIKQRIIGSKVIASGRVQTLKDFESGKVLVFILADFIRMAAQPLPQDDVALMGEIARAPQYRTTPRGKRIADFYIKTENVLTHSASYIPCICWGETAEEVAGWQQGDKVELLGRYQSRRYSKVIDTDTGEREERVAYELSANFVRRKKEVGNENETDL